MKQSQRNEKLVSLWTGLGRQNKTFLRAFPEFKQAIIALHDDGYSAKRLQEITGVSDGSINKWVRNWHNNRALDDMKNNPKFIKIRDEMMHELSEVRIKHRKKTTGTYLYKEEFNAQEHDLTDEWELGDP